MKKQVSCEFNMDTGGRGGVVRRREYIRHSKTEQTQGKGGMNRLFPASKCPAVSPKGVPLMHTFHRMTQTTTKGQIYSGRVPIGNLFYEP